MNKSVFSLRPEHFRKTHPAMRVVLGLLVLICCVAFSSATLKLLQSKLKPTTSIHQVTRYRTVKYPVVIPEAVHPVSYVSTYSVSSPSVVTVPYAYETTYASPAYSKPLTVAPVVQYEPETYYLEPLYTQPTNPFEFCSK